jgi:hypothetical protein
MDEQTKAILRIVQLVFLIIWAILMGFFVLVYFRGMREGTIMSPDDTVKIASFRFCGVSDGMPGVARKAKVCGFMTSNKKTIRYVGMYLYRMPGEKFVSETPVDDSYPNGEFVRELQLPDENPSGHYLVKVYFYKEVIAQCEFDVTLP